MDVKSTFLNGFITKEVSVASPKEKYARNLNKKFDLEQAKAQIAPAATHNKVSKDNRCVCARFQAVPGILIYDVLNIF
ncbi:putative mitochondrial protein [Cucumis melo var. makuwa]|uniref:Mitochondrial protein n=1 Tax=Cucumis melo var. makuwa TaxID=1194695 RepID=A0A5A7V973_CUCMM|nr:putative mitochondrial protein [Cucumis melo var. makuwa]